MKEHMTPEELTALVRKIFTEYESTFAYAGPASMKVLSELASGIKTVYMILFSFHIKYL